MLIILQICNLKQSTNGSRTDNYANIPLVWWELLYALLLVLLLVLPPLYRIKTLPLSLRSALSLFWALQKNTTRRRNVQVIMSVVVQQAILSGNTQNSRLLTSVLQFQTHYERFGQWVQISFGRFGFCSWLRWWRCFVMEIVVVALRSSLASIHTFFQVRCKPPARYEFMT